MKVPYLLIIIIKRNHFARCRASECLARIAVKDFVDPEIRKLCFNKLISAVHHETAVKDHPYLYFLLFIPRRLPCIKKFKKT